MPPFFHSDRKSLRRIARVDKTYSAIRHGADLSRHKIQNHLREAEPLISRSQQEAGIHNHHALALPVEALERGRFLIGLAVVVRPAGDDVEWWQERLIGNDIALFSDCDGAAGRGEHDRFYATRGGSI